MCSVKEGGLTNAVKILVQTAYMSTAVLAPVRTMVYLQLKGGDVSTWTSHCKVAVKVFRCLWNLPVCPGLLHWQDKAACLLVQPVLVQLTSGSSSGFGSVSGLLRWNPEVWSCWIAVYSFLRMKLLKFSKCWMLLLWLFFCMCVVFFFWEFELALHMSNWYAEQRGF